LLTDEKIFTVVTLKSPKTSLTVHKYNSQEERRHDNMRTPSRRQLAC